MESMLWVVLYSSVRWLKHNLTNDQTRSLLNLLFDEYALWQGVPSGGGEKSANARQRKWTNRIKFECPALGEWLNALMDCHSPALGKDRYPGWWECPLQMDQWWYNFLQTHALAPFDRADRKLQDAPKQLEGSSLAAVVSSITRSKRKRSAPEASWKPLHGLQDVLPVTIVASGLEPDGCDDLPASPPKKLAKVRA